MVPATAKGPVPLVLSFHGYGGNGEADVWTFGLRDQTAGKAVMIFPDGVAQAFNGGGLGWDTRNNTNVDMQLVQALIDRAKTEHCIDTSRIYAVGFSWGGWMATQVGCALGTQIRAVASASGGGPVGTCSGGAMTALIAHGTADTAEPIASGQKSRDTYQKLNGCMATTMATSLSPCVALTGCSKPVWWCQHTGGHEVPAFLGQGLWSFLTSAP
jgi:poly(3-hydroxybutyrate) depolymerase